MASLHSDISETMSTNKEVNFPFSSRGYGSGLSVNFYSVTSCNAHQHQRFWLHANTANSFPLDMDFESSSLTSTLRWNTEHRFPSSSWAWTFFIQWYWRLNSLGAFFTSYQRNECHNNHSTWWANCMKSWMITSDGGRRWRTTVKVDIDPIFDL